MAEMTMIRAVNQALFDAMRADGSVCVIGEDVAEGGPYGATRGLVDVFGAARVKDTPISEGTVMGVAIGLALAGLRPVVEIMFIDFITLALDQLVNQAAKARYMSGGQLRVPLVVRTQGGAGVRSGAQHSQSLEAWLAHVPGLAVAMPSTAADAAGQSLAGYLAPRLVRETRASGCGRFSWMISPGQTLNAWVSVGRLPQDEPTVGSAAAPGLGARAEGTDVAAGASVTSQLGQRVANELRGGFISSQRQYTAGAVPATCG